MSEVDQQSRPVPTEQIVAGVDFSGLQAAADKACATIDDLRTERNELLAEISRLRGIASTTLGRRPTSGMMRAALEQISGVES